MYSILFSEHVLSTILGACIRYCIWSTCIQYSSWSIYSILFREHIHWISFLEHVINNSLGAYTQYYSWSMYFFGACTQYYSGAYIQYFSWSTCSVESSSALARAPWGSKKSNPHFWILIVLLYEVGSPKVDLFVGSSQGSGYNSAMSSPRITDRRARSRQDSRPTRCSASPGEPRVSKEPDIWQAPGLAFRVPLCVRLYKTSKSLSYIDTCSCTYIHVLT